jgi:D-alanine-D-alanine ligase
LFDSCQSDRPDAVFNLYEGVANRGGTEAYVAGLLELLRIPYTGCPFSALVLARDKPKTKYLLRGAGLPSPAFFVVESADSVGWVESSEPTRSDENKMVGFEASAHPTLGWPLIVKTATEDASVGIDHQSVVSSQNELTNRVRWLLDRYPPPVLVEQFINGREFNVGVVEWPKPRTLPISEIVFHSREPGRWPLVTYDAKWSVGSPDDLATVPHCPADVAPELARELERLALDAFTLLGCRQYARVDFRTNAAGEPFILEVNPNPDYHPDAGLTRALKVAGISHEEFTVGLVRQLLP